MNSRTSAADSSSPFRFRSISSTACIRASLILGIDEEPLGPHDLPLLPTQPPLCLVEQPLDLAVLPGRACRRDARTLPDVVVIDLRHGRSDPVLELRLRGAQVVTLLLQRMRFGKVQLTGEDPDPAARHGLGGYEAGASSSEVRSTSRVSNTSSTSPSFT